MKKGVCFCVLLALTLIFCPCLTTQVKAHFGMVIPSDSMIMEQDSRNVNLKLSFSHPFDRVGMELVRPITFDIVSKGKRVHLLEKLKKTKVMGHWAWNLDYTIKRPGVYVFYMEPEPYWEPVEDCFIVHHTKTVIAAFSDYEGWDEEIGAKTEIVPLSMPFGLYEGNVFQGMVKLNGEPCPNSLVEVEYYNEDGKAKAPTDYMASHTIKADPKGIFTYAVPKAGWWGFAALNKADYKLKHENLDKDVEVGAVIWVKFHEWKKR